MEPVFILVIFFGGESPSKKTYNPPNGCQIVSSKCLFFVWDNKLGLRIYHGNYLIMDNKHRKPFVIK